MGILGAQRRALRDAVQRGARREAAPLEPGAHAWLAGLTTTRGKAWLKAEGGGVRAVVAKAPEPGAADSAARKAHVQLQGVRHNGRVVRASAEHVWPVAPADPATAPHQSTMRTRSARCMSRRHHRRRRARYRSRETATKRTALRHQWPRELHDFPSTGRSPSRQPRTNPYTGWSRRPPACWVSTPRCTMQSWEGRHITPTRLWLDA